MSEEQWDESHTIAETMRLAADGCKPSAGELIPAAQPQRAILPAQGTPINQCPTNLDSKSMRGRALLVKAGSPGEYEIKDGEPLRIVATHWVILPDFQTDEKSGEVSEFVRVVLFDRDGKHFRTSSAGAPFALYRVLQMFAPEEWAQGIPFVVSTRASKRYRGSSYHDIQIDINEMGERDVP